MIVCLSLLTIMDSFLGPALGIAFLIVLWTSFRLLTLRYPFLQNTVINMM